MSALGQKRTRLPQRYDEPKPTSFRTVLKTAYAKQPQTIAIAPNKIAAARRGLIGSSC